ncbi:unnamed protein product [Zymoseptoria tritici ST99CH_1A5]|uniref:Uncharacterized protein n=2 Tax=Zymoseptoria tritici TaxID=1047171 RepID=A0A1X7RZJ6_ZYMT9|nr:unnamed protein product [Zymoseptoria tritici ST99CH_3D7]SMR57569.1 unnamed protein product [Zymoseptoria tritici ST99CH_3D1]SMY26005.1 unnamed protein product [Zymoseptoria tritici ST99CH_1A5]
MYRTTDPRFRRRLNEIGQTLESANETAQSSLYIFSQNYIKPCFGAVGNCLGNCVDASCPGVGGKRNARKARAARADRAELSFDFYDDWDEEERDGLLGWGGADDFDRIVGGSGGGYGTTGPAVPAQQQPPRQRGMSYPKGRRKSIGEGVDAAVVNQRGFWGRLFAGKPAPYKPTVADLQDHPGSRWRDRTEGEALLGEDESGSDRIGRRAKTHRRKRSGTQASQETTSSYSSRGDLFPSDEEDDAIPLDDEFAMVLERRGTMHSGPETDSSSNPVSHKRGKRPSAGSRASTRRTFSSRSTKSARKGTSRTSSSGQHTPTTISRDDLPEATELDSGLVPKEILRPHAGLDVDEDPQSPPHLAELEAQERRVAEEEEAAVQRKREEALRIAAERGLPLHDLKKHATAQTTSAEKAPEMQAASTEPSSSAREPTQLPSPLPTEDEEDQPAPKAKSGRSTRSSTNSDGSTKGHEQLG